MQLAHQVDGGHAAHDGMVDLEEHGERARRELRDVVEAFDHIRFPQRVRAIERPRVQARNLDHQLPPVTGLRQCDVPQVVLDVRFLVRHPVRAIEAEGNLHETTAEQRVQVHARIEVTHDVLEAYLALGRGRHVVDHQRAHVVVDVAPFGEQHDVVGAAQLLHGFPWRGPLCEVMLRGSTSLARQKSR